MTNGRTVENVVYLFPVPTVGGDVNRKQNATRSNCISPFAFCNQRHIRQNQDPAGPRSGNFGAAVSRPIPTPCTGGDPNRNGGRKKQ